MSEKKTLEIAIDSLEWGEKPLAILEACSKAMEIVGKRFETGECFLSELIMGGEITRQISDMVKRKLEKEVTPRPIGKMLISTVKGDIHDIGKDIVVFILDVHVFEVKDPGMDVPKEKFVVSIREFQPPVVDLSGFLALAFDSMKETIGAIKADGFTDTLKIMIGGGQIDGAIMRYTGADAFGLNTMDAATLSKKWIGGNG